MGTHKVYGVILYNIGDIREGYEYDNVKRLLKDYAPQSLISDGHYGIPGLPSGIQLKETPYMIKKYSLGPRERFEAHLVSTPDPKLKDELIALLAKYGLTGSYGEHTIYIREYLHAAN